jgi:hypoxanthine phosphoribosyltransferase
MSDAEKIEVLVPEDQLMARIDELADRLAPRLTGDWTVVSILIGATPFTSDLMKALARRGVHPMLDVIWLESYRDARESSGRVVVRADLSRQVKDRGVLLLDDVFDTGRTLEFAKQHLLAKGREGSHHLHADPEALGPARRERRRFLRLRFPRPLPRRLRHGRRRQISRPALYRRAGLIGHSVSLWQKATD